MSNQPNKDRSNRAKSRRRQREAARVPGKGAGPVPIRAPAGQPAVNSLADLAKAGGQVPLSIPQLMAQVGTLKVERDFWMNAAVTLEDQVNVLTGGVTSPSVEDVAAAEGAEEIQDIPTTLEKCPGCGVTIGPEDEFIDAVHADDCTFEGHIATEGEFAPEEGEEPATPIGANVPAEAPVEELTPEEQQVVNEAELILANQRDEAAGGEGSVSSLLPQPDQPAPPPPNEEEIIVKAERVEVPIRLRSDLQEEPIE